RADGADPRVVRRRRRDEPARRGRRRDGALDPPRSDPLPRGLPRDHERRHPPRRDPLRTRRPGLAVAARRRARRLMLSLERVTVRYGGVTALDAVSLTVERGRILGLIGPNGAGKTTLVNATTGLAPLAAGRIVLDRRRIDGLPAHRIARAGIARTYQNIRLFGALDVRGNLAAGAFARHGRIAPDEIRSLLE